MVVSQWISFSTIRSSQEGNPASRNLNDSAALAIKVAKKAELKQKEEEAAKETDLET